MEGAGPNGQQEWKDRSESEFEARYEVAQRLLSGDDSMDDDRSRSLDSGVVRVGRWCCTDTVLWQGKRTTAYKARHEHLESVSMAGIFQDAADYKVELDTLKRISDVGVADKSSLFMALAMGFLPNPESENPVHCLVYRHLPTVDECLKIQQGNGVGVTRWSGPSCELLEAAGRRGGVLALGGRSLSL